MALGLLGLHMGLIADTAVGLQAAIFGTGDSFWVLTGSNYGTSIAARLSGEFVLYSKTGAGFPGAGSLSIRNSLKARSIRERKSVIIFGVGRNDMTVDASVARTQTQGIIDDLLAIGNTRWLCYSIPLTVAESAAGAGNAGYDAVVAHNAWLVATYGAGRVADAQTLANDYPAGDGVHIANAGYDILCMRLSDKLKALGFLDTSLPTARATYSVNLDITGKYIDFVAPAAAFDTLPKTPAVTPQTWAVWYKGTGSGVIFGRYGVTVNTARFGIRSSGGSLFGYFGNNVFTSDADDPSDGTLWHLLVLTQAGKIYMDGVQQGTTQVPAALSTTYNAQLGDADEGSFPCAGKYYQPLIYDVNLTDAEQLALYNAGVPLAPSASPRADHIVSYLDFDHIYLYAISRGVPDRVGTLDARATGMSAADLSTDRP